MKIEKHGTKYRVRKMYKGAVYLLYFDHEPNEKEITLELARQYESSGGAKGSFERFANAYIENRRNVVSPNTLRTYNTKLNQLSDAFKEKNIQDMTGEDIQAEVNRLAKKYEPKTVKTTYGFITAVMGTNRPSFKFKVKLPQNIEKAVYEPTSEDIKRILAEVKGTEYSVAFQLGVWGCREGEICALTLDDLKGNLLHIHRTVALDENNNRVIKECPKTDESNRVIPLPETLAEEIRQQGFIYEKAPNRLNKKIHEIQKKLGIPPFRFHALRHYFASYAHSLGIPEADILKIGGWKTASVMRSIYRKSMEQSLSESIEKMMVNLYHDD